MSLFSFLRNIFKQGDGGVHNDQHESLSDEDKVVEDYIEVGKFVVNRMSLADVVGFVCDLLSECFNPLKAILKDGSTVELDYHKYVLHDDEDMSERLMEIDAILSECDKEYIQDKIKEESIKFYSNNL